jgi:hypothetical protein
MKALLTTVCVVLLAAGFVWYVERQNARDATNHATTGVYAVQQSYLNFRSALNEALELEKAYEAAQVYDEMLRGVFTMMDVYSKDRNMPDTYAKYGDKFRRHDIVSLLPLRPEGAIQQGLWDTTPLAVFAGMRSTFAQPLDPLIPGKRSWQWPTEGDNSDVFWIAYDLKKNIYFQNDPDRPVVENRLKEIRSAFEGNPDGFAHIKTIVSRRSEEGLWRPLLDHVASNMTTASGPSALPGHLAFTGSEKWTAWDISRADQYRCLNSFLPWKVQANGPAEDVLFIVVYKRSSEYVGYYAPEGGSYPPGRKPANSDAYVESAHVVVGRANPFEVYGVRTLRSKNPPATITTSGHGTGGYGAIVGDDELSELFSEIRGERREISEDSR